MTISALREVTYHFHAVFNSLCRTLPSSLPAGGTTQKYFRSRIGELSL